MIVSFLDILGFSELLGSNPESAYDSLTEFNLAIKTNIFDEKNHPVDSYPKGMQDYVKKHI